ncbi:hypothetical protein AAEX28_08785 [Lentisphaerota bacterium WC36G]|nr:hypothetical protein LJT99_11635 [Lentisphaerae bacterium WC36]
MGTFNKIVISLVAVLAIATAVISYFLFEKREQYVKGSEKTANAIGSVVKILDSKSGTKKSSSVNADSLHHTKYSELEGNLKQFEDQVKKYAAQRDALANTVATLSKDLQLSSKYKTSSFQKIKSYEKYVKSVKKAGSDTLKRNKDVYAELVNTSKSLGYGSVSVNNLQSKNYKSTLSQIVSTAKNVKDRQDSYGNSIVTISENIGLQNIGLMQSDYKSVLGKVESKVRELYLTQQRTKEQLTTKIQQYGELSKLHADLKGVNEAYAIKIEDLQNQVNNLLNIKSDGTGIVWVPGSPNVLQRAKGKIIDVNKKWNYVVIDIGYDTTVVQSINGKPHRLATMLKEGYSLVVARDMVKDPKNAFVGKINLTKVDPYCSIADIDPDTIKDIKVGDTVFFSDKFLNDLRKKMAAEKQARIDKAMAQGARIADKIKNESSSVEDDTAAEEDKKDEPVNTKTEKELDDFGSEFENDLDL